MRERLAAVWRHAPWLFTAACVSVSAVLLVYAVSGTPLIAVVHGSSMSPGRLQGDVCACAPGWDDGDVAIVRDPTRDRVLVKRVVAIGPCDVSWTSDGHILINGQPFDEPYASYGTGIEPGGCHVASGQVFVAGDNRGASMDSRSFGPVSENMVRGRVLACLWHIDMGGDGS